MLPVDSELLALPMPVYDVMNVCMASRHVVPECDGNFCFSTFVHRSFVSPPRSVHARGAERMEANREKHGQEGMEGRKKEGKRSDQ